MSLNSSSESENDSDNSCHAQQSALNEYAGFCPPPGITHVTDRVTADVKPTDFFERYVKNRQPAVFSCLLNDSSFNATQWTNSYLSAVAGDTKVLVEDRECPDGRLSFGTSAPKIEMRYGDFVKAVTAQDTRYYLTTQDLERFVEEYDEFGLPKTVAAQPLRMLSGSYPLQPAILGNLVPHQVSLWQGCAGKGSGSSSGLHHDFHDNLYLLIRGRKRFRLFPPSAAASLRVSGHLAKIHRNGLIVYESFRATLCPVTVRADGAPLSILARHKCQTAEQNLERAECELEQLRSSASGAEAETQAQLAAAKKLVSDYEQHMDSALGELLRYTEDRQVSEEDDDYGSCCGSDEPASKRPKQDTTNSDVGSRNKLPDHFCDVKLSPEDNDNWQCLFSPFDEPANIGCMIVELCAGEMLYLPASWFHEVTSYDDSQSDDTDTAGHLALNYWMYPPDGDTFEQPYADDFWPHRWATLCPSSEFKTLDAAGEL